jgi:hypothetical protein
VFAISTSTLTQMERHQDQTDVAPPERAGTVGIHLPCRTVAARTTATLHAVAEAL